MISSTTVMMSILTVFQLSQLGFEFEMSSGTMGVMMISGNDVFDDHH
jgi:hypothetical protein